MNDSELDKKLKAARGPALEPDYAADFPRLVLAALRSAPPERCRPAHPWRPRLAWGLAAAVGIVMAFAGGRWHGRTEAAQDVLANSKLIEQTLAMFPNRVRAIVCDEHGMNLLLSDQADVPASTPIYVRLCDGEHCSSLVTFSGQDVQIGGQEITVLSDATGGIILEGNRFAWSSSSRSPAQSHLKIEAKNLEPFKM
jgi:hypothetical protein